MTASPMQLIIMLYDECLRSLDKGIAAFAVESPDRFEQVGTHLLHAQDVITELAISLDMEKGGEIAHNLHRLYDFAMSHLSRANVQQNVKPVHTVVTIMTELKEAWLEVAKSEPVAEETAPPRAVERGTFQMTG